MKIKVEAADVRLKLTKDLSTVYDKFNKNLTVLDRLYKRARKLQDKELKNHLEEAIKRYSRAWELE